MKFYPTMNIAMHVQHLQMYMSTQTTPIIIYIQGANVDQTRPSIPQPIPPYKFYLHTQ